RSHSRPDQGLRVTLPSRPNDRALRRRCQRRGLLFRGFGGIHRPVQHALSLGDEPLTLGTISEVARGGRKVAIGKAAQAAMARARRVVDTVVAGGDASPAVYGVNTGFGALAEVRISAAEVTRLQQNLVRSHAAGVGAPLPRESVRAMMLLRAAVLATGRSGARPVCCERLCALLNAGVHP